MDKKVLVGIITYAGEKYCREIFFQTLKAITYPNVDFVFVTNSGAEDKKDLEKHAQNLQGTTTVRTTEPGSEVIEDICAVNREAARQYFLKGDWSDLVFIDSDVIAPTNMIELMLKDNKDLVSGVYLNVVEGKEENEGERRPLPVIWVKRGEKYIRASITDMMVPRLIEFAEGGMGCCQIRRAVLEQVGFRQKKETNISEDIDFFRKAIEKGFTPFLDTRMKCNHLKFPVGNEHNRLYDWRSYQLQVKVKK